MKSPDVIIVGGGPAGSAAAISLNRSGKQVLLLEKEPLAHHKVCGEFISFEAIHYLAALGVNLKAIGAERIDHVRLIYKNKSVCNRLPFQAYSLSRRALDEALLTQAEKEGVEILRGTNVTEMHYEDANWHLKWNSDEARADTVFLATGKHDIRGWTRPREKHNDMIGFKMHYRLSSEQTATLTRHVEIIPFIGGYAGIQLVENGITNLCLVVKKSRFSLCGKNWDDFINNLLIQSPHLRNRLNDAITQWPRPLAIFGIPYSYVFKKEPLEPSGLFRLGDQMGVIPSFSGEGIALALHTASHAVSAYLKENSNVYHANVAKELNQHFRKTVGWSLLISIPFTPMLLLNICKLAPSLLPLLAKITRLKALLN